jgi:hypothetical protein
MSKLTVPAVLTLGLIAAVGATTKACIPATEKLVLKSGYSGQVLADAARRITLTATLDLGGTGTGTLVFDPNVSDGEFSTAIALREVRVKVRLRPDANQTTKGRLIYELTETGLVDGKEVDRAGRWLLVRPVQAGQAYWLLPLDKDGTVTDVLKLDAEPQPVPAAKTREC